MDKDTQHVDEKTLCYHCGETVVEKDIVIEDKTFCCTGCKTVYEIINQNGLCDYYEREPNPGINQKTKIREGKFGFLEDEKVVGKLIYFKNETQQHVKFYLPQMHCSSCIWLLENLHRVNAGVLKSQVDFVKKEVTIVYDPSKTNLRKVAETLTLIGYEPHISLHDIADKGIKKYDSSRIIKLGVAGFCFGNIMMLSFPEYFSLSANENPTLKNWFNALNVLLSLPVFFYCASEFFTSAYSSLKQKFLNIDAPIALAIVITFIRSLYEIGSGTGPGYLDSMSGIVFFMLVGRYFQNRTYQGISFDRDYTSYFPLGVTLVEEGASEKQIPVSELKVGARIKIHNEEIIPADAILFFGKANIDYSFVTGESLPVEKSIGEIIYAGGKQVGGAIELEVVKEISQSYLTQLWNNESFTQNKKEQRYSFIHYLSRYFTYILFAIAISASIFWQINDPAKVWQVLTAVLIVACPCALLLSATFTNGAMLSMLQKNNFFVKNASVIEAFAGVDTVVFDKTGTISLQEEATMAYVGETLNDITKQWIRTLANQSSHPLSKVIVAYLPFQRSLQVKQYLEVKGYGSSAWIEGHRIKLGSAEFVRGVHAEYGSEGSKVYVSVDDDILGCFVIRSHYRNDLEKVIFSLKRKYHVALISGDNDAEAHHLRKLFGTKSDLLFNRKPIDKLHYIKKLQEEGHKVIMVGDGLNDAGALQQSDIGIAVSDNINNFSPGCDAILEGKSFGKLKSLFDYCTKEKQIIYGSFAISILYNLVGLSFAVSGALSPVIAAILMPVSSISIVLFTTASSAIFAKKIKA